MEPIVRDVMSDVPASLDERQSLVEAAELMKRRGLRIVPVLGQGGRFKGALLWRDAERALGRSGDDTSVAQVCRRDISIAADEPVAAALAFLEREQVGSLPVVEAERPVGMVSRSRINIARELLRHRAALEELRPPDELLYRYNPTADNFFETGIAAVSQLRKFGLQPHHHVLDPGCGAGRIAIVLTQYLSADGGYQGFDLFRDCIEWASQAITPRYPTFHFTHADVRITQHNPDAEMESEDFTFPYGNDTFDFVVLSSVFTHMLPGGFERYLSEIARVLKPGGRIMASYLLLNDEVLARVDADANPEQPLHDFGIYRVAHLHFPEAVVAYQADHVLGLHERLGLGVVRVMRGDWETKDHPANGRQDFVIAEKTRKAAH
jgi:SAM-dependent methyltransferase